MQSTVQQVATTPRNETVGQPANRAEQQNPAFAVIDKMQAERSRSAGFLASGDPVKSAQVRDLSERYGTTRTSAEINFDTLFAQACRDDADEALADSPALARYFADNPKDAPIFKKDVGLLGQLEAHFRKLGRQYSSDPNVPVDAQPNAQAWNTEDSTGDAALDAKIAPIMNSSQMGRGVEAGWLMGEQGLAWAKVGNDKTLLTDEFRKRDAEIDKRIQELGGEDTDAAFYNAGQVLGTMAKSMMGGIEGAGAGGALATGAMAVGAVPVAGQALMGAMAVGAGAYGTYQLEGGLELKALIDQGVPYEKAVKIASGVGMINSLIEMAGIKVLGDAVAPALRGLTSKFVGKTAAALEKPSMQSALLGTAKSIGMGVGQEVVTETLQEVSSIAGEELGRVWGETGKEGITGDEFFDRILEVAEMTAKGAGVLGALGAGPVMIGHMNRIAKAQQTQEFFENLSDLANQMEGAKLSPGATKELVDNMAQNVNAGTIYIDGYAFRQVMAESNVTSEDLEKVLPGVAKKVDAAAVNGTDITMSTGDFAARLAQSPFGQKLMDHMRLNKSDLSPAEGKSLEQSVKEMRKAALKEALTPEQEADAAERKRVEAIDGATRKVQDRFYEQIKATGRFTSAEARQQAAWGARVVSNWAKRTGIPVDQLADRAPIVSFDSEEGMSLNQKTLDVAEKKLQVEVEQWAKTLDDMHSMPSHQVLMLTQTPVVMHLVGADFKELYVTPHMFERLFKDKDGSKGTFGKREMAQIPQALTDPVAIFDQKNERKLFLLDIRTESGAPVIVPVEFSARKDFAEVNIVVTAFAKEKDGKPKFGWLKNVVGRELYVNTKKLASLNTSSGANSHLVLSTRLSAIQDNVADSSNNILTEKDLVNIKEKYPDLYQTIDSRGVLNGTPRFERKGDETEVKVTYVDPSAVPHFEKIGDLVQWLKQSFNDRREVTIQSTGQVARFTNTSLAASVKKSRESRKSNHTAAYPVLDQLVASAEYEGFEPVDQRHPHLGGQDVYLSALQVSDQLFSVKLKFDVPSNEEVQAKAKHPELSQEDVRYKDHSLTEIEIAPVLSEATSRLKAEHSGFLGRTDNQPIEGESLDGNPPPPSIVKTMLGVLRGAVKLSRLENGVLRQNVRGSFSPEANTIHLTPNADLSTFAHEMGHWYLENILQMAVMEGANESLKADVQALLNDFGLKSVADWQALPFEEKERLHERFAYQVELYLTEGKAPTKTTEGFFRRLGAWIRDVYRAWTQGASEALNARYRQQFGEDLPELSDEVRRVMDRMIAGEDAVSMAEQAQGLTVLFEQKPAGMSDADWADYQASHDEAGLEAAERLAQEDAKNERWYTNARSKALKDIQRKAKETRGKIREKVALQVNSRKEFVALDLMRAGNRANVVINLKLAPETLENRGLTVNQIAKLRALGVVKKGGVDVTTARELLRPFAKFNSDKQLINALLMGEDKEKIIEDLTTQECMEKHSDLFDPAKRDQLVSESLHSEARARMVATELKYLLGDRQGRSRIYMAAAYEAAKALIARTRLGQTKATTFMAAESRAARKAQEAFRKGDRDLAAMFKRQQLVNHEAARLVLEVVKEKEKLKDLRSLVFRSDKKLAGQYDTNIFAIARVVLSNRGFGKKMGEPMDAAEDYLEKVKKYDEDIVKGLQTFLDRNPYSPGMDINAMPLAMFQTMFEDVQALVKLARDAK